jgi:hypothetical protein
LNQSIVNFKNSFPLHQHFRFQALSFSSLFLSLSLSQRLVRLHVALCFDFLAQLYENAVIPSSEFVIFLNILFPASDVDNQSSLLGL